MSKLDDSGPIDAESLYALWRDAAPPRSDAEFEEFCARQPLLAAELRRLRANDLALGQVLGPEPSSAPAQGANPAEAPFRELVERLQRHRPLKDRYEEREEIGRGGMGSVLEVYDVDLRRSVAKKVMLPRGAKAPLEDTTPLVRFCEEAQVTAQLTHPGVVPVHELGLDGQGRVYFTMDLVRGRTLQAVIDLARHQAEDWSIQRAVGVIQRVCETLAYAHSKGVVHRDLKPSNIMVGAFGEVYVMDWGLARLLGQDREDGVEGQDEAFVSTDRRDASDRDTFADLRTGTGTVVGTPGYMAPEQARGRIHEIDARTDVYAVGAILYTLLAGVRPYDEFLKNNDYAGLLRASREGRVRPLRELGAGAPAELISIAERAMAFEPEGRYPTASALADDLRRWLEGRVVSAHESGLWPELRKWVRRNRALAGALFAVFVALSAGGAGVAAYERKGRIAVGQERTRSEIILSPTQFAGLFGRAEEIWPSLPQSIPNLLDWKAQERELDARRLLIEAAIADDRSVLRDDMEEDGTLRERLLEVLSRWKDLEPVSKWVDERLAVARSVEALEVARAASWKQAIEAIRQSDAYSGFELTPQDGLVPLRVNQETGLWEFWHVLSGDEPIVDPLTGNWKVEESTGIVLILIPAGTSLVGALDLPQEDPLYDGALNVDDGRSDPLNHEVTLDAYFISKYELTQAQWRRARGKNDSQGRDGSEVHPADTVSWNEAVETLGRLDLVLPTEAQWEVAARGGAETRFSTGQAVESLRGHCVLFPDFNADGQPDRSESGEIVEVWGRPWRPHHEPVGSALPNGYGLHDVHGNVWEWCLDVFDVSAAPRPGDGLRLASEPRSRKRVFRGGGYRSGWWFARVSYRYEWEAQNSEPDTGVRPARPVRNAE